MKMLAEFKAFLTKSNALALAIGVVIGAAVGKVVAAVVDDFLMPTIGLIMPKGGSWRDWAFGENKEFKVGHFLGVTLDFMIVAFVVFVITKALLREAKKEPTTKPCPECLEQVPIAAKRCKACTQAIP